MNLSEDQRQSLITSLLGFVRRVSFQGADSPEEAETLPVIVSSLLGEAWLFDCDEGPVFVHEEETESYDSQKSENSGGWRECECGCCRCFLHEK